MKKLYGVFLLALIIGALTQLPTTKARELMMDCDCNTPLQVGAMVWGHGSTCSAAFLDGLNQARAAAGCEDGICWENVIIDNPCSGEPGDYMIDLHIEYRCYNCMSGPGGGGGGPYPVEEADEFAPVM